MKDKHVLLVLLIICVLIALYTISHNVVPAQDMTAGVTRP